MNFKSDNVVGIHPNILEAIIKANQGTESSYGNDSYSEKLKEKCCDLFETEVDIYLTSTGTAANCLGLSALAKPYETICCHEEAHINTDECGALGLFTAGTKLVTIPGINGKIDLDFLQNYVDKTSLHYPQGGKVSCISITQATECGTIYSLEELHQRSNFSKSRNLSLHMDGARFANSLVTLNCSPAEATWKAGIDVMTFGAIKNGTMAGEAIIFFNKKYAENFDYLHMRSGQLLSKMRFFACQFLAYLEDDLWLKNARNANLMATKLAQVFRNYNFKISYPIQANEVFIKLPNNLVHYLRSQDIGFYDWNISKENEDENLYRFLTSYLTNDIEIEKLYDCLKQYYSQNC